MDPSSTVLHYAPTLFEGMKAYKGKDGVARLFRPDKVSAKGRWGLHMVLNNSMPAQNMERMVRSAARLAFPVCPLWSPSSPSNLVTDLIAHIHPVSLRQAFSGEHLQTLLKKFVQMESNWIPTDPGTSLCTYLS